MRLGWNSLIRQKDSGFSCSEDDKRDTFMHKAPILGISLAVCVKASLGFDRSIKPREVRSDVVVINQYAKKKKKNIKAKVKRNQQLLLSTANMIIF